MIALLLVGINTPAIPDTTLPVCEVCELLEGRISGNQGNLSSDSLRDSGTIYVKCRVGSPAECFRGGTV